MPSRLSSATSGCRKGPTFAGPAVPGNAPLTRREAIRPRRWVALKVSLLAPLVNYELRHISGPLPEPVRIELYQGEADPFGVEDLGLTFAPKDRFVIAFDGSRPVAAAGWLERDVQAGSHTVAAAGSAPCSSGPAAAGGVCAGSSSRKPWPPLPQPVAPTASSSANRSSSRSTHTSAGGRSSAR